MSTLAGARWVWLSLAVVAADQATKFFIERAAPHIERAMRSGKPLEIIPGFLNLIIARNRGVAFSIFADSDSAWLRVALIVLASAAVVLFAWLLSTGRAGNGAARWGFALVLAGAAGNLIDRILFGSVLDFLDFYVRDLHWPAFNVADSAITIGAILIFWEMMFAARASGDGSAASEKS